MCLGFGGCGTFEKAPPECLERLSEKSLSDLWSASFGSATPQEGGLCAPFQQFVRSSDREFEGFQTVSEEEFSGVRIVAVQYPRPSDEATARIVARPALE
jgi:hypothetical protein